MKLIEYLLKQPVLLCGLFFLCSCGDGDAGKVISIKPDPKTVERSRGDFDFYKDIEIRPGINFEVVSWGKGADSVGGYLVLMSDFLKNKYKSLSNEREGIITDAWNMDLDTDGNPEIYIELRSKTNVLDLEVYEYAGGDFNKITFPGLSSNLKKYYAGNDKYVIKNGDLFRTFPVVNSQDSTLKEGTLKIVQYKLSGNDFFTSEVKE